MTTWRLKVHMNLNRQHIISEQCVEYPAIHRETVTRYRNGAPVAGSAQTSYYVDEPYDKTEYGSFEAALKALRGEG
jgi:hypothetical protein